MSERARLALSLVVTLAVPVIAVGTATVIVVQPWIVDAVYATPGFPDDPFGMQGSDRAELARDGVRSVAPLGPGIEVLREARLPGGRPAFTPAEVEHMQDVRQLVMAITAAWIAAIAAAVIATVSLRRAGSGKLARRGAVRGAILTLASIALAGILMLLSFDAAFSGFHAIFFDEGSWTFASDRTLIRIYPERFWSIAAIFTSLIVIAQAVILWLVLADRRRTRTRAGKVR